jgi:hypothetical protein
MGQNRFDDLTRALATGLPRRQALKLLGGSLLAALIPGSALAKGGGNSACAKFCAQVFGADTAAAKQCTSEGAKDRVCVPRLVLRTLRQFVAQRTPMAPARATTVLPVAVLRAKRAAGAARVYVCLVSATITVPVPPAKPVTLLEYV